MRHGKKYEPAGLAFLRQTGKGVNILRILVLSDSHGDASAVLRAIREQPKAELVLHLGDGEEDMAEARALFRDRMFLQVRGNCDFASALPATDTMMVKGIRLFFTHGHLYSVKCGDDRLREAARSCHADVALYGHTHMAETDYEDGLYLMNPGSVRGANGSYGIVDITDAGIVTAIVRRKNR